MNRIIVCALAAYRVTVLVVVDGIAQPIRDWVWRLNRPKLFELIGCQRCFGFWASLGMWLLYTVCPSFVEFLAVVGVQSILADSGLTEFLEE